MSLYASASLSLSLPLSLSVSHTHSLSLSHPHLPTFCQSRMHQRTLFFTQSSCHLSHKHFFSHLHTLTILRTYAKPIVPYLCLKHRDTGNIHLHTLAHTHTHPLEQAHALSLSLFLRFVIFFCGICLPNTLSLPRSSFWEYSHFPSLSLHHTFSRTLNTDHCTWCTNPMVAGRLYSRTLKVIQPSAFGKKRW